MAGKKRGVMVGASVADAMVVGYGGVCMRVLYMTSGCKELCWWGVRKGMFVVCAFCQFFCDLKI